MLRSKYFWLAVILLVLFIIVWVSVGFGWAIATLIVTGLVSLLVVSAGSRRERRRYYYDEEEDKVEDVYITRRRQPQRSDIQRGLDWHVPKVNKDGVEFLTGAEGLRKTQRDAMRRTKKSLWG
jgi:hypothetical protein